MALSSDEEYGCGSDEAKMLVLLTKIKRELKGRESERREIERRGRRESKEDREEEEI